VCPRPSRTPYPSFLRDCYSDPYDKAKAFAFGWDVYPLEAEWQTWGRQQKDWPPKDADAAFLGFCKRCGGHPG